MVRSRPEKGGPMADEAQKIRRVTDVHAGQVP